MRTRCVHARRLIGALAVFGFLAVACASDSSDSADASPTAWPRLEAAESSVEAEVSGDANEWIDGEPDWDAGAAGEPEAESFDEERVVPVDAMAGADVGGEGVGGAVEYSSVTEAAAEEAAAAPDSVDDYRYDEADGDGSDRAEGTEPDAPQRDLTGGSIDDNERFEDYLAYRERFLGSGIPVRDLDPTGRIIVTVTGEGGLPAAGAEVVVSGEGFETSLRATADGSVRFHPAAFGAGSGPFTVTAGGVAAEADPGESIAIETALATVGGGTVALDILFLLDATGSMDDEIDQLKATIAEVSQRINRLPSQADLRLGMTLYRDEGDEFVTATFDFTHDVDVFAEALDRVVADGGGDNPEALDEALAEALGAPSWRPAAQAVQLVFLVADAPPQIARNVPTPYTASMLEAAERGVKIFPVSSSGTDDQAEYVFRQLAQFTGARYVFLTYGAAGRATGGSTDITELDYEELSLDYLIVRLISEELEALTGTTDGA